MSKIDIADAITAIHFVWIFYVLIGQILILIGIPLGWKWIRNFWFRFTHLTMMVLVATETLFSIDCPLTVWEKHLRGMTGRLHYGETDSFIARWLGRLIFYETESQWPFIAAYLAFTILVVWSFWLAPPRLGMSKASFVGLIHAAIGTTLLSTAFAGPLVFGTDLGYEWGVGVCFLIQAWLWYALQDRPVAKSPPDTAIQQFTEARK